MINNKSLLINEQQKEFVVRSFKAMVGTEFSGQENIEAFKECAFLWYNKKHEIFDKLKDCFCDENDINLRDFICTKSDIVFIYKCDYCWFQQGFRYKRGK